MTVRGCRGSNIAELPVVVFFILFFIFLPLLNLATICIRANSIYAAARNAAHYACRADSFEANSADGKFSAKKMAKEKVRETLGAGLSGVRVADSQVRVFIIGTPVQDGLPTIRRETKLNPDELGASEDIDPEDQEATDSPYLFQTEVSVTGEVEPLLTLSQNIFGSIPGLTMSFPVTASFRENTENIHALTR